mgnify:CR=1 FL=1
MARNHQCPLAIIPARTGSKGIATKNFRPLGGLSPVERALGCVISLGLEAVVSVDSEAPILAFSGGARWLTRPPELAQDETPMADVIAHVLATVYGPHDQPIVLLQPTQPLRDPRYVKQALSLLNQLMSGTIMSVTAAPSPDKLLRMITDRDHGPLRLESWEDTLVERRQDARPAYRRDGTVYAWRRGQPFMGQPWVPLIVLPEHTCPLDTEDDWREAERRLVQ